MLNTKLTVLLGIRTPIVEPPMAFASGGALAAAVSEGGGFGFLSGDGTVENLKAQLNVARSALNVTDDAYLPVGVGFRCWALEQPQSPATELLTVTLDNKVKAVWFAFGSKIPEWIRFVRQHDQQSGNKTIVFVQVTSKDEADMAVHSYAADVVVVQGIEAGGHGSASAPPLLTLVPQVLSITPADGPAVLAAGGLANGSHIAAMLALGCSGVALGTRFLLTPESLYTDAQRNALIDAKDNSTVRTMAFDYARGTLEWPAGIDGRALRNATVDDFEAGVEIEVLQSRFKSGTQHCDPTRMLVWAGTGVSLMNSVEPAKVLTEHLHRECVEHLKLLHRIMPIWV